MRIGIPKEHAARENRIAAVPASVKTFVGWEWDVAVETGAGVAAGYPDELFIEMGAAIVPNAATAHDADLVLRVGPPTHDEIALLHAGSVL